MNNSLALINTLAQSNNSELALPLTDWDIQGWQSKSESEPYKDKPFELNYKLLELAQQADPNGLPAKLKETVDSLTLGSQEFHELSLRDIYVKYLEGKNPGDAVNNPAQFNDEVREYQAIVSMFIDDNAERNKYNEVVDTKIVNVGTESERLEKLFRANESYYTIEVGGLLLYVKSTQPDTYRTNHSLEIRYMEGNSMKKIVIDLGYLKTHQGLIKTKEYGIRTSSALKVEDVYGGASRVNRWLEGDLDNIIKTIETDIKGANDAKERAAKRLETMDKSNPNYERFNKSITEITNGVEKAEAQRQDLINQQRLLSGEEDINPQPQLQG